MTQIIGILGVDMVNKGADLIQEEKLVLGVGLRCGTFRERNTKNLFHLPWIFFGKPPLFFSNVIEKLLGILFSVLPEVIRRAYHLIRNQELTAILDASGFGYTDQHGISGLHKTQGMALKTKNWKREGKKIIFLPQAFGPFLSINMKNAISEIVANSDILFVRDRQSFTYLVDIVGDSRVIKLAPDFTCLVEGIIPSYFIPDGNRPCIIPNYRMIDRTLSETGEKYELFLINCLEVLIEAGLNPFILIHEKNDLQFALKIKDKISKPIEIIQESDPILVKGILGTCGFVISSRYHGLVSALSQGVPCLATGWSHKYLTLLEDYNCPEFLVDTSIQKNEIKEKIELLRQDKSRHALISSIKMAALKQRQLSIEMWNEVNQILTFK
jgi:hypothetical protein